MQDFKQSQIFLDAYEFIEKVSQDISYADHYLKEGYKLKQPYKTYRIALERDLYDVAAAVIRFGLNPQYYKHDLHTSISCEIDDYYTEGAFGRTEPEVDWTKMLIQIGAYINPLNEKGQTPLDVTIKYPHPEAISLLKASGAKHSHELTLEEKLLETNFYVVCRMFDFDIIEKCLLIREKMSVPLFDNEQECGITYALVFSPEASKPPFGHLKLLDLIIDKYNTYLNTSLILAFLSIDYKESGYEIRIHFKDLNNLSKVCPQCGKFPLIIQSLRS
jgi:hypothetical protein